MTKVRSLVKNWHENVSTPLTDYEYSVSLPLYAAAKIEALTEMFPSKTKQQIITELLTAALDELEEAFPYIRGDKVIGEDECGDPIYNDAGFTPTLISLTNKYLGKIASQKKTNMGV